MIGAGRTRREDGAVPFKRQDGSEDWLLPGGCAGCGFNIGRYVAASSLLACPDCRRALCLVCYVGKDDKGFARQNDFPEHRRLVDREFEGPHGETIVSTKSKLDPNHAPCVDCAAKRGAA